MKVQYKYMLDIPIYELDKFFSDEELEQAVEDYVKATIIQYVFVPDFSGKPIELEVEITSISCKIDKQYDVEEYIKTNLTKLKKYEV
jgi:hypothetical protein